MKDFIMSYGFLVVGGAFIVGVGILVTQGLLDGEWADRALGFFLGGGITGAVALKVQPTKTTLIDDTGPVEVEVP